MFWYGSERQQQIFGGVWIRLRKALHPYIRAYHLHNPNKLAMHSCICIYHTAQNPLCRHAELFEDSSPAWRLRALSESIHQDKKQSSNEKLTNSKATRQTNLYTHLQNKAAENSQYMWSSQSLQNLSIDRASMVKGHPPYNWCNMLPACLIYSACLKSHMGWENVGCGLLACCNEHSYPMSEGVRSSGGLRAVMKGKPWEQPHLEKRLSKSKEGNPLHDWGRAGHNIAPQHCIGKKRNKGPEHGGPQPASSAWSSLGSKVSN